MTTDKREMMHAPEKVLAPDFDLIDTHGNRVCLSDFRGQKPVVLVLLRGFI